MPRPTPRKDVENPDADGEEEDVPEVPHPAEEEGPKPQPLPEVAEQLAVGESHATAGEGRPEKTAIASATRGFPSVSPSYEPGDRQEKEAVPDVPR